MGGGSQKIIEMESKLVDSGSEGWWGCDCKGQPEDISVSRLQWWLQEPTHVIKGIELDTRIVSVSVSWSPHCTIVT